MIFKPKIGRSRLYDKLHAYTVYALWGISFYGLVTGGYFAYRILRYGHEQKALQEAKPDAEILQEQ